MRDDRTVPLHDEPRSDRPSRILVWTRVVVLLTVVVGIPHFPSAAVERYLAIAHTPGTPYRTFPVEYPLGELIVIKLTSWSSEGPARALVGLFAFGADIIAFLAVRARAGVAAGRRYLLLGTPLLIFIYRRTDLVSVAVVAIAVWLLDRRRDRASGATLALGVLMRLWPIVLAPAFVLGRRLRALVAFVVALVAGALLWISVGGLDAPRQVLTFRGATGWELESSVGTVVWIVTGERRFEAGAFRAGTATGQERLLLAAVLIAMLVAIWRRAWRAGSDPYGVPAAASVAATLLTAPVLSPGYVAWLLPWIAMADRKRFRAAGAVPMVVTGVIVAVWYLDVWRGHPVLSEVLLVIRNASLIPIVLGGIVGPGDAPRATEQSGDAAATA
jgi:Glycosyltransferase family 87